MKSPHTKFVRLFTEKYVENLETMFKNLLKDETLSDVTIYCKDGSVKAHRIILASCSPYFQKVFREHPEPHVVFIMNGVTAKQMKSLVELMYRGSTDVSSETMSKLYEVAEELGVKGIVDDNDKATNGWGRDTRFKGQKRVAVDFKEVENERMSSPKILKHGNERRISSSSDKSVKKITENVFTSPNGNMSSASSEGESPSVKQEPILTGYAVVPEQVTMPKKNNSWALKQRKYKCTLCPSSFKRASHLTRHQLVHTGERPFACDQCEKAFSRHDKLKHHIRKAHEMEAFAEMLEPPESVYTMGHVEILTPNESLTVSPTRITREDLMPRMSLPERIQSLSPENLEPKSQRPKTPLSAPVSKKKGRGRPRKYPPVPRPLVKRPRGRPRLNPVACQQSAISDGQLTPTLTKSSENYDITNMPFGDLEYLTKPLMNDNPDDPSNGMEPNLMEPLVEIKMEPNENVREENIHSSASSFLENIGLLENSAIAKIGECTISVTSSCS